MEKQGKNAVIYRKKTCKNFVIILAKKDSVCYNKNENE